MRARCLGLLALVACGDATLPPPPGAGDHGSGTRLRAMVLATDDGLTVFQGDWFDTELDERCSFADGLCLPRFGVVAAYRDPACTELLYRIDLCDGVPRRFISEAGEDGCDATRTIRRVGALAAPAGDTVYSRDAEGRCGELVAEADLYAAGDVVPRSTFVSAERTVSSGRPRAAYLVAEDGAYEMVGWEEAVGGAPCWARPTGANVLCVPANAPWVGTLSADSACASQIVTTYPDVCSPPPTVAFCESCDDGDHFIVLEDAWDGAIYDGGGSTCAIVERNPDAEYRGLGAVRAPERLGLLTREAASGTSPRVQPSWRDTNHEGYTDTSRWDWYDTMFERPCYFYPLSDGTIRCLVLEVFAYEVFSDPACTTTMLAAPFAGGDPPAYGHTYDGCSMQLATLGDATTAYRLDAGGCVAFDGTFYPMEAQLDLSMFVEATPTIE